MTIPTAHAHSPRVLGRYVLGPLLGHGATARVLRAHDQATGRPVAVKEIPADLGLEHRVGAEIRAASRLDHPGVVRLVDWGEDRGCFYLVSELVEGETLDQLLASRLPGGDRQACDIAAGVLDALAHAHARGVIHRDVKPANVIVDPAGEPRLLDFGVARLTGEASMTLTGSVIGTMAYMPPEQAAGERVGSSADVYAASLVLYEALTGANPILADTPLETARRAEAGAVPPLSRVRPDLPRRLCRAVEAGLARDPAARPGADSLARVLREESETVSVRRWLPAPVWRALPAIASAGAAAALGAVAAGAAGLSGPVTLAVAAGAGALAAVRPAMAALVGVLATAAIVGHAAPALGAVVLAAGLLLLVTGRARPRLLLLPALAPVLLVIGLAPVYALVAGMVRGAWARAWAAVAGAAVMVGWAFGAGAAGLAGTGRPGRGVVDLAAAAGSPVDALERASRPFQQQPEALVAGAVLAALALAVPLVLRARPGAPRLVAALGWMAVLTVGLAMASGDAAAAVEEVLPSCILVAAWAARPWRVLLARRSAGRAAPLGGTAA